MHIAVILPAAGRSERFAEAGGGKSKLEMELAGRAVLVRAVELFSKRDAVCQVIVAAPPDQLDAFKLKWGDKLGFLGVTIVAGGVQERWETVLNALRAVEEQATHIAVHDAARPVTPPDVIDRVFEAAGQVDAVIPATPIHATIKRAEYDENAVAEEADPLDAILGDAGKIEIDYHRVTETVPRQGLWQVQTPQVFKRDLLERAYAQITEGQLDGAGITDDAGLVEALGEPVYLVPGDEMNIKITRPGDLKFAAMVLGALKGKPTLGSDPLGPKRKFPQWKDMEDA